jgi:hypothetical protein
VPKIQQGIAVLVRHQDHRTATPTITAFWATMWNVLLAAPRDDSIATAPGFDLDLDVIQK